MEIFLDLVSIAGFLLALLAIMIVAIMAWAVWSDERPSATGWILLVISMLYLIGVAFL